MDYDMRTLKEIVLDRAGDAYCEIGRLRGSDTCYEEELVGKALYKVLEAEDDNYDLPVELVGASYMLQAIIDNLRKRVKQLELECPNYPF